MGRQFIPENTKLEIQRRYITSNLTQKELAIEYNIHWRSIQEIVKGLRRYQKTDKYIFKVPSTKDHNGGNQQFTDEYKEYLFYGDDDFWKRQDTISYDETIQKKRTHPINSPPSETAKSIFNEDYKGDSDEFQPKMARATQFFTSDETGIVSLLPKYIEEKPLPPPKPIPTFSYQFDDIVVRNVILFTECDDSEREKDYLTN